jgi:hypothetical protein
MPVHVVADTAVKLTPCAPPWGAKGAGSGIADSIAEDGLSGWLETVRRHHEGTYQHCLLVTGIAVDFGLSLGLAKPDIERRARSLSHSGMWR